MYSFFQLTKIQVEKLQKELKAGKSEWYPRLNHSPVISRILKFPKVPERF